MKNLEVDFNCPNCQHRIRVLIKDVVPGRTKKCPSCQSPIQFTGDDGRKVQRELDKLEKTIKKLNRTYRIKI
jgi:transcription elongation factor Elf1